MGNFNMVYKLSQNGSVEILHIGVLLYNADKRFNIRVVKFKAFYLIFSYFSRLYIPLSQIPPSQALLLVRELSFHNFFHSDRRKQGRSLTVTGLCLVQLLSLEHILAEAADGAGPILGDLFPGGAGRDAVVRIADGGVVDVTAGADVLHYYGLLSDARLSRFE